MKVKKSVKIIADSYEEEQFLMEKFPDAWWDASNWEKTIFYLPRAKEKEAKEALKEFKKLKGE